MEMTPRLEAILNGLEQAEALDGLQDAILKLRDHLAVDHLVYHWVDSAGEQYGCGTYDAVWVQRYIDQNYMRIDPVVAGCYQRFHPVDWKRLDWSGKPAKAFQQDALAHGIGNQGFSIPVRGPNGQFAVFTVNSNAEDAEWQEFTETKRSILILIAHFFNDKAIQFEPNRTPEHTRPLSPRELESMTLLAMGYSRAQTAETLQISEHTLRVYIESARFKLNALNTVHAVAKALARGLIIV